MMRSQTPNPKNEDRKRNDLDGVHVQFNLKDLANVNILNIHFRTSINVKFEEISNGYAPAG
jgi:hypothetical protein